jgi:hypothetical protein
MGALRVGRGRVLRATKTDSTAKNYPIMHLNVKPKSGRLRSETRTFLLSVDRKLVLQNTKVASFSDSSSS